MRLIGQIQITMANAETVHREPGFWDKLKRGFGGKIDLDTGEVRVALEATAMVDQVKRAFGRLGIDNAVSLVIDDTIIFQDIEGRGRRSPRPDPGAVRARVGVRARFPRDEARGRARGGRPAPAAGGPRPDPAPPRRAVGLRLAGWTHPRFWNRERASRRTLTARASSRWRRTPACSRPRACSSSRSSAAWRRRCGRRCPRRRSRRSAPTRWSCARRRSRRHPRRIRAARSTIRTPSTTRAR